MNENPSYYAVIPASIRYDKRLPANSKLLFGEITALCNKSGYCWATNGYFADLYDVSTKSISTWISKLSEYKYIKTVIEYKPGTKEILHRYIQILPDPMEENFLPYGRNLPTPMEEKVKENTTSINTTINNTRRIEEAEPASAEPATRVKKSEPVKHKYGEHGLVKLSDSQLATLKEEFPDIWEKMIKRLDEYKKDYEKTYKDDLKALKRWVARAVRNDEANNKNHTQTKQLPVHTRTSFLDLED